MDKQELLTSIKKDRRSPGQIFESLRQEIIACSEAKLSDEEATKATRNLIGLFEVAMDVPIAQRTFQLDEGSDES